MGDPSSRNIRHGASPFGIIEAKSYSRLNPWHPITFTLAEGPIAHKGAQTIHAAPILDRPIHETGSSQVYTLRTL